MISEKQFQIAAKELCIELATIKAVADVESGGVGIIDGKPVILFEPHIFWKQLRAKGIDPATLQKGNEDILYPIWGTKPYPSGQAKRWEQLDRAIKINRNAALNSASWGRFQIMGFNSSSCGCKTVQELVNKSYESEDMQLNLFVSYIKSERLDDELKAKDWAGFARQYNGASYFKNKYDKRLAASYEKYK